MNSLPSCDRRLPVAVLAIIALGVVFVFSILLACAIRPVLQYAAGDLQQQPGHAGEPGAQTNISSGIVTASHNAAAKPQAAPPLPTPSGEVLTMINPADHTRSGLWTRADGSVCSSGKGDEIITIPVQLPDEFDMTVDFRRLTGDEDVGIVMRIRGHTFLLDMGAVHNTVMGVDMMGSRSVANAPDSIRPYPGLLRVKIPHQLWVKVRKDFFQATLDHRCMFRTSADYASWRLGHPWMAADGATLALASRNSSIEFHSMRLTLPDDSGYNVPPRDPSHPMPVMIRKRKQ